MSRTGKRVIFVVILFGALLAVGILITAPEERPAVENRELVGRIKLSGSIVDTHPGFGTAAITPELVGRRIREAEDRNLQAVVLRIDSPGGSVAASQEIYNIIQQAEIPIIISMGDMAASGGYYISAPADVIVAQPGTMTGSIGVIYQTINPEGLLDMLGIKMETITSGEHKDMAIRELTDEERQLLQDLTDNFYDQFIDDIVGGRDMDESDIRELATGEIFSGQQALNHGLVDLLGGMDEALAAAGREAELDDPVYYDFPEPGLWEQLRFFTANFPEFISLIFSSSEEKIADKIEDTLKSSIEYRVPGY